MLAPLTSLIACLVAITTTEQASDLEIIAGLLLPGMAIVLAQWTILRRCGIPSRLRALGPA